MMYPYLSSTLVANRAAALEGMLAVSDILMQAGERYASLVMEASRRALELSGQQAASLGQPGTSAPIEWLEQGKSESTRLLEEAYAIACDTHSALIAAGDSQVQRFDQVVRTVLQRAADWSPWEGAVAFNALRTSLDTAENTIHDMAEVAAQTIEVAEKEAHLIASAVAAPARSRSRKKAA